MAAGVVAKTPHFVLHQWSANTITTGPGFEKAPALFVEGVLQLGALTPKRWAKRAVTRNLIKRQIFNVAHTMAHQLQPTAYVVRLRSGFPTNQYPSAASAALKSVVRAELEQLFTGLSAKP
jgi:ribonuclease P protein component